MDRFATYGGEKCGLEGQLMTAGELAPVWPDAKGNNKGRAIAPLFKSVPFAVRTDPQLYEYLALADAIRMGNQENAHWRVDYSKRSY